MNMYCDLVSIFPFCFCVRFCFYVLSTQELPDQVPVCVCVCVCVYVCVCMCVSVFVCVYLCVWEPVDPHTA